MSTDTPSGMAMMMNDAPTIGDRISQLERELAAEQEKVKRLTDGLNEILLVHANEFARPKAFYIASATLEATK